ncbi:MAG: DUF3127 domain-containing protein [Bacteroidales bacterium]|nr:DUF3127 domain-containing protein [Bacteroidales bacterium]MBN2758687.1 DUF3127 domain-containing protein [Bacteroidales bacterium]
MSLEIEGKVVKILPEQTGEGKNGKWVKQDFVIETSDQYPKKVCFSTWGEKATDVKTLGIGENVVVSFNAESREYQNKWYTDLRAWRIAKNSQSKSPVNETIPPLTEDDIPPEENDDLPF